jgi:hypothetical protein
VSSTNGTRLGSTPSTCGGADPDAAQPLAETFAQFGFARTLSRRGGRLGAPWLAIARPSRRPFVRTLERRPASGRHPEQLDRAAAGRSRQHLAGRRVDERSPICLPRTRRSGCTLDGPTTRVSAVSAQRPAPRVSVHRGLTSHPQPTDRPAGAPLTKLDPHARLETRSIKPPQPRSPYLGRRAPPGAAAGSARRPRLRSPSRHPRGEHADRHGRGRRSLAGILALLGTAGRTVGARRRYRARRPAAGAGGVRLTGWPALGRRLEARQHGCRSRGRRAEWRCCRRGQSSRASSARSSAVLGPRRRLGHKAMLCRARAPGRASRGPAGDAREPDATSCARGDVGAGVETRSTMPLTKP